MLSKFETKREDSTPRRLFLQDYKVLFLIIGVPCFSEIFGTFDTIYRDLCSKGIGVEIFHAPVITPDKEDKLQQSIVLRICY